MTSSSLGWMGAELPGLVDSVPGRGRGVGMRGSLGSLQTQTLLWFCVTVMPSLGRWWIHSTLGFTANSFKSCHLPLASPGTCVPLCCLIFQGSHSCLCFAEHPKWRNILGREHHKAIALGLGRGDCWSQGHRYPYLLTSTSAQCSYPFISYRCSQLISPKTHQLKLFNKHGWFYPKCLKLIHQFSGGVWCFQQEESSKTPWDPVLTLNNFKPYRVSKKLLIFPYLFSLYWQNAWDWHFIVAGGTLPVWGKYQIL